MKHAKKSPNDRRHRALVHVQKRVEVWSALITDGVTTTDDLSEDDHWWTAKPPVLLSVKLATAEYEVSRLKDKLRIA